MFRFNASTLHRFAVRGLRWRSETKSRFSGQDRSFLIPYTRSFRSSAARYITEQGNYERPIATAKPAERKVHVEWSSKTSSHFHHIWLRDHCRCSQCFHPITKQRLFNSAEIPADIEPSKVESQLEGLLVTCTAFIIAACFFLSMVVAARALLRSVYQDGAGPKVSQAINVHPIATYLDARKKLWDSSIARSPPTVDYDQVMAEDEKGLYRWLTNINEYGISFVSGVPTTPEATKDLAERIGFIRETQYGRFWDFTSDLAKGDTAYTTLALGAHTDTTYFSDPCGLQMFHLLSHTEGSGGASLLVDGFHAASMLQERDPKAFRILSTVPVPTHAAGEPKSLYQPYPRLGYPVLNLHPVTKQVFQVRWNNDDRSVLDHVDSVTVGDWYAAIRAWNACLADPSSEYWVQLQPGTVVIMDNHRVLHGRSAFTGKRRMCGAYIGMDEYQSKLAVLSEKFAPDAVTIATRDHAAANGRNVWHPAL